MTEKHIPNQGAAPHHAAGQPGDFAILPDANPEPANREEKSPSKPNEAYTIILFYKYVSVENPEAFVAWHKEIGPKLGLTGRVHIAREGINATLEGLTENIETYVALITGAAIVGGALGVQNFADLRDVQIKTSIGIGDAFPKFKAKVRPEIVSLMLTRADGIEEDIDPNEITGTHLKPAELKKWYDEGEDFVIIDMRNDYEFKVGHFKNSINAGLKNFRDLPEILPKLIEKHPEIAKKKILTVCTGGVRCEKASGFLMKKGLSEVYQLDGGMHKYMEEFPGNAAEGKPCEFRGALYTFDDRMTMDFVDGNAAPDGELAKGIVKAKREIIGRCQVCENPTERYGHCANDVCHAHLLICRDCAVNHIYVWCSNDCKDTGRVGVIHSADLGTEGVMICRE
jgi:UPF0176 protein